MPQTPRSDAEARAEFVQLVVRASADLPAKALRAPTVRTLRTIVERLLPEISSGDDPLARARIRGVLAGAELTEAEGGVLSASDLAGAIGISRQAVDKRRLAGQLLAIELGGRGYRYPAWQLGNDRGRRGVLAGLDEVLAALAVDSPLAKARFFLSGNHRLGGKRPLDLLRKGKVEAVVRAAAMFGEHGAA